MKIGIFTDAYEPHVSGVTTSIKMLKSVLEAKNHEVYIVTANLEKHKFKYDEVNKIVYIPGIKTGIYNTRLTNIYSRKAFKIIKKWNLDVIHSQTEFGIGAFSRIVSKKLKIPVVHTYHTLYEDYVYYVTHGHFDKLSKKIIVKLTKYYCDKKCDELIVPTTKIQKLFINKYKINRDIHVIPTGIDTKKFELSKNMQKNLKKLKKKYKIKDTDFIIGSVGRIAKEKSFDLVLDTAKELININKNIKIMIVGDGPELDNLRNLATDLNISDHIIFTGKVDYDLIPSYYHLFNIMTSFSTTETQGLTVIEALASSLPVLCVNDESFKKTILDGYNGFLFSNNEDFVGLTLKLIKDKKLYQKLSNNAQKSMEKYSKDFFAEEVLKVYKEAIIKKGLENDVS